MKSNANAASPDSRFVGSRHSSIYHRTTCPHAKRIKPNNLVSFKGRRLAAAGRKPCKTCKPGRD